ncbi:ectoine/hydroxyectoine ABC transporter substrate-binding protein EhuB [Bradyrhizobium tunisiense]|uniref:ectoine/hydroxyectoine ABC transporter substrate-binding protein EhuB n=1 Tax=Bradyrhizobium tunisiense TaxID=3278709 RepID=UPI0035D97D8D
MRGRESSRRVLLVVAASAAVFCAGASVVCAQSITDRVLKEGKITIGIHNRPPWGFKAEDGTATGFHPDLIRAVLGPVGVKQVDFLIADWGALIPSLLSKRIDAIATGMQISPARCDQVIFSNPDLAIKDTLAVQPGNPYKIHSFADVAKDPAIRIGAIRGATIQIDHATKADIPKDRVRSFPDYSSLVSALFAGRVDGLLLPPESVTELLKDPNLKGKLERAAPFVGLVENDREVAGYSAIVFRPEDAQLRDLYNESFAKRRAEGTLKAVAEEYGFADADIAPEDRTARVLCPDNYR